VKGILRLAPMLFRDRAHAGRFLADKLAAYADGRDTVVLGLPRGGVPVAFEVATALHAALDVFVVRKLGVPGQEELAMGATASGKVRVLNHEIIGALGISDEVVASVAAKEERELERREGLYRGDRPQVPARWQDRYPDDGLATGSTMRAAVEALKRYRPDRVVVGVPVAAVSTCEEFINEVDEIVCRQPLDLFCAVSR
jgi:putative phosphoribosyl transferase